VDKISGSFDKLNNTIYFDYFETESHAINFRRQLRKFVAPSHAKIVCGKSRTTKMGRIDVYVIDVDRFDNYLNLFVLLISIDKHPIFPNFVDLNNQSDFLSFFNLKNLDSLYLPIESCGKKELKTYTEKEDQYPSNQKIIVESQYKTLKTEFANNDIPIQFLSLIINQLFPKLKIVTIVSEVNNSIELQLNFDAKKLDFFKVSMYFGMILDFAVVNRRILFTFEIKENGKLNYNSYMISQFIKLI
jgi:hypothetical protein